MVCEQSVDVDWANRAATSNWYWPTEPSLFSCTMQMNDSYQAVLRHAKNDQFVVQILREDELRLEFPAHAATVFDTCRDLFVYAEFTTSSSGCTVIASDLKTRKQLWAVPLEGLGPIAHKSYRNRVSLSIVYGVVNIYGWESGGKYLELLDLKTGKVLGHRVFERN